MNFHLQVYHTLDSLCEIRINFPISGIQPLRIPLLPLLPFSPLVPSAVASARFVFPPLFLHMTPFSE